MIRKVKGIEVKNLYEALGETVKAKENRRLPYLMEILPNLSDQKKMQLLWKTFATGKYLVRTAET
jgi:hypothetical protein